ncbi:MAG: tetratricopeptide repeat protein [Planctomycetes bacterium]|nr:tetratricopeptide repeat protein [Planctomycetota bacterium]
MNVGFRAGDLIRGRYQIEGRLGAGSFGVVYKAWDKELTRPVVLKVPRQAARDRLLEEARRISHLSASWSNEKRPPIQQVYDVVTDGTDGWPPCIVLEHIEGRSLEESLQEREGRDRTPMREGIPGYREALGWLADLAEAAQFVHEKGLCHRDLAPKNIVIDLAGQAHLIDFGLSIRFEDQFFGDRDTGGTPAYMAPEQFRSGGETLDGRADVYALGVILYRLLTGRLPYQARTSEGLVRAISEQPPQPPRQRDRTIPQPLEDVCLKCLQKAPHDRYGTAGDLAAALHGILVAAPFAEEGAAVPPRDGQSAAPRCAAGLLSGPCSRRPEFSPGAVTTHFKGRVRELADLERLLTDPNGHPVVGIWGPPGVGKSSLARVFCKDRRRIMTFTGGISILYARGRDAWQLAREFAAFGREETQPGEEVLDPFKIMAACLRGRRALLVLDDVTRDLDVRSLIPGGESRLLVVTRDQDVLRSLGLSADRWVNLPPLSVDDAVAYLGEMLERELAGDEREAARRIWEYVGGLPLALFVAARRIHQLRVVPGALKCYAERLKERRLEVLRFPAGGSETDRSVDAVFEDSLTSLGDQEREAFLALAACAESGFSLDAAEDVMGLDPFEAGERLTRLVDLGLVQERDDDRFVLHTLLYRFAREKAREEGLLDEALERHAESISALVRGSNVIHAEELRHLERERDAIVEAARWMLQEERVDDERFWRGLRHFVEVGVPAGTGVELMRKLRTIAQDRGKVRCETHGWLGLGRCYLNLKRPAEALDALRSAIRLCKQTRDPHGLCLALRCMGSAYREQRDLRMATLALEKSLEVARRYCEEKPRTILPVLNTLGVVLREQGDNRRAQEVFAEALALSEKAGDLRMMGVTLNAFVGCLRALGRPQEAEPLVRESLDNCRKAGARAQSGRVLNILAAVLREQGRSEEADEAATESARIADELGDMTAKAHTLRTQGKNLQYRGALEEGAAAYRQSLDHFRHLGDRQNQADVLRKLGSVYARLESHDEEAIACLEEQVSLRREIGDRRGEAGALTSLGDIMLRSPRRRSAEGSPEALSLAERHYRDALRIRNEVGPQQAMSSLHSRIGKVLSRQGNHTKALGVFKKCLKEFPPRDPRGQAELFLGVARVLADQRKSDAASHFALKCFEPAGRIHNARERARLLRGAGAVLRGLKAFEQCSIALEASVRALEGDGEAVRHHIPGLLLDLAVCHEERGDLDGAVRAGLRVLATADRGNARRILVRIAKASRSNARGLRRAGNHADAIPHFRRCVQIQEALEDRKRVADSLRELARACWDASRCEEALDAARRALDVNLQLGDPHRTAHAYALLGRWCVDCRRPDEAVSTLLEALARFRELADVDEMDWTGRKLRRLASEGHEECRRALAEGRPRDAEAAIRLALRIAETMGDDAHAAARRRLLDQALATVGKTDGTAGSAGVQVPSLG